MPLPLLMGEWVLQLFAGIHYTARCVHTRLMSILQPGGRFCSWLMNGQVACSRHHDIHGYILVDLPAAKYIMLNRPDWTRLPV